MLGLNYLLTQMELSSVLGSKPMRHLAGVAPPYPLISRTLLSTLVGQRAGRNMAHEKLGSLGASLLREHGPQFFPRYPFGLSSGSQGIGAYLPVFQLAQLVVGQGRVVRTREEIRGP